MELIVRATGGEGLQAGYACPCGCTPAVTYVRGAPVTTDACCCGNQFAVGMHAAPALVARAGYRSEARSFMAPWGEELEAAWSLGPGIHDPAPSE